MTLYNLRTDGDQYRMTKFDNDLNVISSYLLTETECECPAGARPTCRHRQMLPEMIANDMEDTGAFYDFETKQILVSDEPEPEPTDEKRISKETREAIAAVNIETTIIRNDPHPTIGKINRRI